MSEVVFNLYKKQKHFNLYSNKSSVCIKILDKTFIFRFFIFYTIFLLINSTKIFMFNNEFIDLNITVCDYIYISKLLSYKIFFLSFRIFLYLMKF